MQGFNEPDLQSQRGPCQMESGHVLGTANQFKRNPGLWGTETFHNYNTTKDVNGHFLPLPVRSAGHILSGIGAAASYKCYSRREAPDCSRDIVGYGFFHL